MVSLIYLILKVFNKKAASYTKNAITAKLTEKKYMRKSTISAHLTFLLECLKLLTEVYVQLYSQEISNLVSFFCDTKRTPKPKIAYLHSSVA